MLTAHGFPIGGGSYQRLLPAGAVDAALRSADGPAVLYYHSYDFGATLPSYEVHPFAGRGQAIGGAWKDRRHVLSNSQPLRKQGVWSCRTVISRPISSVGPTGSPPSTRASRWPGCSGVGRSSTVSGWPSTSRSGSAPSGCSMSDAGAVRCSPPSPRPASTSPGSTRPRPWSSWPGSRRRCSPAWSRSSSGAGSRSARSMPTTSPSPSASSTTSVRRPSSSNGWDGPPPMSSLRSRRPASG